jgi:hypothetical protein
MSTQNMQMFIVPQLLEGLGPVNAAAKKMAGQMGIDDPREVFRRINSGEWVVTEAAQGTMHVWKTVKLGLHKSPNEYRMALRSALIPINPWADSVLSNISCSQVEIDVDLVIMSVADLGFKRGGCYANICTQAIALGLELCPAEVGPALCLQSNNQVRGECVHIAMEAAIGVDGNLHLFNVSQGNRNPRLSTYSGLPGDTWRPGARFVFVRPR